jgi:esterase
VSGLVRRLQSMQIETQVFTSRNEAQAYISSNIDNQDMVAFLMSNLQVSSTPPLRDSEWKFNLPMIVQSLENLLKFPLPSPRSNSYEGPLLIVKASNSPFVLSKHLSDIKTIFSKYSVVSLKDCGHWMHAEKPEELANILSEYVSSFD